MHDITNKEAKQENEGTEREAREPLRASEQDGERMGLYHDGDSSMETGDENKLDLNINHSERANTQALSSGEDHEEHSTHPEELNESSSGMEHGRDTNCKANVEEPGDSCKVGT